MPLFRSVTGLLKQSNGRVRSVGSAPERGSAGVNVGVRRWIKVGRSDGVRSTWGLLPAAFWDGCLCSGSGPLRV